MYMYMQSVSELCVKVIVNEKKISNNARKLISSINNNYVSFELQVCMLCIIDLVTLLMSDTVKQEVYHT